MLDAGVEISPIGEEIDKQASGNYLLTGQISLDANAPDTNISVYFDVLNSHQIQINDNITDNWLENSTVVNDCIAQQPIEITLSGISSELVYTPSMNKGWLKSIYSKINDDVLSKYSNSYAITDKLTIIPELYPPLDNITQTAKNIVTVVENNVQRYTKILNNFRKNKKERQGTRLEEIYKSLIEIRNNCKKSGEGLTVLTPYGEFENMFIRSISLTQENLNHITDISVTLKQINFSNVIYSEADKNILAEFNQNAKAQGTEEDLGKVTGKKTSLLKKGVNWLGNWLGN